MRSPALSTQKPSAEQATASPSAAQSLSFTHVSQLLPLVPASGPWLLLQPPSASAAHATSKPLPHHTPIATHTFSITLITRLPSHRRTSRTAPCRTPPAPARLAAALRRCAGRSARAAR